MIKPKIRFKGYQESGNSVSWGIWQNLVKEVDILKVI